MVSRQFLIEDFWLIVICFIRNKAANDIYSSCYSCNTVPPIFYRILSSWLWSTCMYVVLLHQESLACIITLLFYLSSADDVFKIHISHVVLTVCWATDCVPVVGLLYVWFPSKITAKRQVGRRPLRLWMDSMALVVHLLFFFNLQMIATSILYLAGKVEEEHVRLTDVINVTYR